MQTLIQGLQKAGSSRAGRLLPTLSRPLEALKPSFSHDCQKAFDFQLSKVSLMP
ncbi:Uncharacterised protein [Delftia tsuruhatensis]|uniref:hypothetical protein n=1 Tax=Delftia tsuruhatensis TaxID=180282 RepID=UPI001E70F8B5|nr:hypothetical protein [Delftia tsuruhatensis]CAB5720984.1 Uncharacterised protein [Delftia tsuruhatensis]CAC9688140.1 Uncharacterised protein [Delftia tsuruhatensis]